MKIKPLHPLISCICITHARPQLLLKSILSFDQQNYPNTELVISYPISDLETKSLIAQVKSVSEVRILEVQRDVAETIGIARNNAVSHCNGEYVCMWDDDDIYFFSRVADQYNLLQGNGKYFQASVIEQIILFDAIEGKGYLSIPYNWAGSLLCKKQHFLAYPCTDTDEFECTPILNFLQDKHYLLKLDFNPQLYIYVFHSSNKTEYLNFKYLCRKSIAVQEEFSQWIFNYLNQDIILNLP